MRSLLKGSTLPSYYWVQVPTGGGSSAQVPMLLPHELFAQLVKKADMASLTQVNPEMMRLKTKVAAVLAMDPSDLVPLGLHGDAVPHQHGKSIEVFSWNFLAEPDADRFLITTMEKRFCCNCGCSGRHSLDPIIEVVTWSLKQITLGLWPDRRHDGTPFAKEDKERSGKAGASIGARGALMTVRSDWAWLKQIFSFPAWSNQAICFRCAANKSDCPYTDMGQGAAWRTRRYSSAAFWAQFRAQGLTPSPLFSLPGFSLEMVAIDLLHAGDLGVTQDLLGNVCWEFFHHPACTGTTQADRLSFMWAKLKAHYAALQTTNRVQKLTREMFKQDRKPPKLRTKGAETRGCLPWGLELAMEMAKSTPGAHSQTVLQCVSRLMDFYVLLSMDPFQPNLAKDAVRHFAVLYSALSKEATDKGQEELWRVKPKFHMLQELCEYQVFCLGNPKTFWAYKDEDFVGWIAALAFSRGGPKAASTAPKNVLDRYRALTKV